MQRISGLTSVHQRIRLGRTSLEFSADGLMERSYSAGRTARLLSTTGFGAPALKTRIVFFLPDKLRTQVVSPVGLEMARPFGLGLSQKMV